MSDVKVCSRDDCPPSNIKKDCSVNCGKCNALIHLMCIGISKTASEVLIAKNVVILCDSCIVLLSSSTSTTKSTPRSSRTVKSANDLANPSSDSRVQRSILEFARPNDIDKSAEILSLLNDIKSSVLEHRDETKTYASVLAEFADKVSSSISKPRFSSVSASNFSSDVDGDFPPLNGAKRKHSATFSSSAFTPKRSRTDPKVLAQKSLFTGRKLTPGTNINTNHGLGGPDAVGAAARNSRRNFVNNFKRSLYVTKLKPSVTEQSIAAYLKANVSGITDDSFTLRLLVKKGQNLDELNFISFRLDCDEGLFSRLSDPSFWPQHVMIGEFVEKSKPKKNFALGDFLLNPQTATSNQSPSTATDLPPETPTQLSPRDGNGMDTGPAVQDDPVVNGDQTN